MSGRSWAAGIIGVAVTAAILGPVGGTAFAAPRIQPGTGDGGGDSITPTDTIAEDDSRMNRARGIIVATKAGGPGLRALSAAADLLVTSVDVVDTASVGPRTNVLLFNETIPRVEAQAAADVLATRPGVDWAVPDMPVQALDTPVIPNDPRFGEQWDLWDGGGSNDFSVNAPLVWGRTTGATDIVVAVLDTGITSHPDLNANLVTGYDMISDARVANDGTARDPDPADTGDWITEAEASTGFFEGCRVIDSTWHGTHVTGTIAALQNNGIGVSGLAPGVKVQTVRVLGKCGGFDSDIAAAITWASGGSVTGVPANATPADVINMSLGGQGMCSAAYSSAISAARARGTTVVVAAGNSDMPVTEFTPANCPGVISVAATSQFGHRAYYSNYGTANGQMTIAAPGGDGRADTMILSTYNSGTTSPGSPTYAFLQGTSMAAPHVAAGAALAYSLGHTTPADVAAALVSAVQPFPSGSDCTGPRYCGAGILDLSLLTGTTPSTVPGPPQNVTAVAGNGQGTISWQPPSSTGGSAITSYTATASPGGATCTTASTSCTISGLTNGTTYTATVTATNATGTGTGATSNAFTPTAGSAVPGAPTGVSASVRSSTEIGLTWIPPSDVGSAPIDYYRVQRSQNGGAWVTYDAMIEGTSATVTNVDPQSTYSFKVSAVNSAGQGPWSAASPPISTGGQSTTPGKVRNVKVRYAYGPRQATATLSWKAPSDTGGSAITGYRARIRVQGGSWGTWANFKGTSATATKLRPGKRYSVAIQARNANGFGATTTVPLRP